MITAPASQVIVSGREEDDVDDNIPDLNERGLHLPHWLDESFIPGALSAKFRDHILVKVLHAQECHRGQAVLGCLVSTLVLVLELQGLKYVQPETEIREPSWGKGALERELKPSSQDSGLCLD